MDPLKIEMRAAGDVIIIAVFSVHFKYMKSRERIMFINESYVTKQLFEKRLYALIH